MVTLTLTDRQYQAVLKAVWAQLEALERARATGNAMHAARNLRNAWDAMTAIRGYAPLIRYKAEPGD